MIEDTDPQFGSLSAEDRQAWALRVEALNALLAAPAMQGVYDQLIRELVTSLGEHNFSPVERNASRWQRAVEDCVQECVIRRAHGDVVLKVGFRLRFYDSVTQQARWAHLPNQDYYPAIAMWLKCVQDQFWPHFQAWRRAVRARTLLR